MEIYLSGTAPTEIKELHEELKLMNKDKRQCITVDESSDDEDIVTKTHLVDGYSSDEELVKGIRREQARKRWETSTYDQLNI